MQRVNQYLDLSVDPRPLAIVRIVVAVAALIKVLRLTGSLRQLSTGNYVSFSYPIDLPSPQSDTSALLVVGLWITFGVFFLLGIWTRYAGAGLALTILYAVGIDQQMYSNHLYLLVMLVALLTIADSGARYSLDSSNDAISAQVPRWPVTLIKLQITSVYLFAALSKLNRDFLDGVVIRLAFDPGILERVTEVVSVETLAVAAIATELFLAAGFWVARLRWVALPVAVVFHTMNVVLLNRSGALGLFIFAVMMCAALLLFFTDLWEREPAPTTTREPQPASVEGVS